MFAVTDFLTGADNNMLHPPGIDHNRTKNEWGMKNSQRDTELD